MSKTDSVTNVKASRRRAREHVSYGPVTAGYSADREIARTLLTDSPDPAAGSGRKPN